MELRIRKLEMNMDLCLNYVREMAKTHLTPARIRELENVHEDLLASLDDAADPGGE